MSLLLLLDEDEEPFQELLMETVVPELIGTSRTGSFELAVVAANMACELETERAFAALFKARGLEGFRKALRRRWNNISDQRTRDVFNELSGRKIQDAVFWQDFVEHVKRRDEVVHGGKRVSKAEAAASQAVARKFIDEVLGVLKSISGS